MANSQIKTRIIHKHDTAANWELAVNFIPKQGEIIIYDKDSTYNYERFKIGDGATLVSALPFANDALKAEIQTLLNNAVSKLDGIEAGANKTVVDTALSSTSTNPVQNKAINSALSGKQDKITGAATTITGSNLTAGRVLVSDGNGKVAASSSITTTELGYLGGVSSGIQNQLDSKISSAATGVQSIAGGLVVGGDSAISTGKGRIMLTGSTNPLVGLRAIDGGGNQLTPYYFQVVNDIMYIGPTSSKALACDSNGNTSVPAALSVTGSISEGGTALSSKYAPYSHASSGTGYGVGSTSNYGHIKVGSNISVSSGIISLTKTNVTNALGYTPPTSNTTYSAATYSTLGLVKPAYTSTGAASLTTTAATNTTTPTIAAKTTTSDRYYAVEADKNGVLFVNVPWTNTNTHYTTRLYAGASGTAANAAATNPYLKVTDDNTYRNQIQFKGGGATTVSSDANGVITISSTDNNTVYTHPTSSGNKHIPSGGSTGQILRWSADGTAVWGSDNNTTYSTATSSTLGLVKIGYTTSGKNYAVQLSNGQMYVNVPWTDTNTTYSAATTSAAGLMSATDKNKLNTITEGADSVSFTRSLTSGTKIGTITINGTGTDLYCQTNTNTTYSAGTGLSLSGTTFNISTVPIANGGTNATSKSGARTNLGITSGTSLPSSGSAGDIFLLYTT